MRCDAGGMVVSRLIAFRCLSALATLLVVSAIIFWMVEWLPGDTAERLLGRDATAAGLAALRDKLQLGVSPWSRYGHWLVAFVQGDLGTSVSSGRPVADVLAGPSANTLLLTGVVLVLYFPLSLGLGVWGAVRQGGVADHVVLLFTLIGMCIPEYVVAIALTSVFAVKFGWLPPLALIDQAHTLPELIRTLALPTITLTAAMTAYGVRMTRECLIDVLRSGYVDMAHLKGIAPHRVLFLHALPNALGPALNVTALNIAWLTGGIVIVETIFNFPGLGRLLVDAINIKDVPVILAVSLLLTGVYVLCNLLADIGSLIFNPKLRSVR